MVIFFEGDEVYSEQLLKEIQWYLARGQNNLAVHRIQLEQNFQRCRQYPIPVHRIFPKGAGTYHIHLCFVKKGDFLIASSISTRFNLNIGFVKSSSNLALLLNISLFWSSILCIKNNTSSGTYHIHPTIYPKNSRTQIDIVPIESGLLWDVSNCFRDNWLQRKRIQSEIWGEPRHLMVAEHFTQSNEITEQEELAQLNETHWLYKSSPFNLPDILKVLVGKVRYEVNL